MMKRLLIYLIALLSALMLRLGYSTTEPKTSNDNKAPEFLYVLSAKSGEIKKIGDNEYTLTMNHTDIDHVLVFSDRPHRIVKYISAKQLATSWKVGENSFEKNHPNAGLVAHGLMMPVVIELLGMRVIKDQTLYNFSLFGLAGLPINKFLKNPETLSEVSLFIDASTDKHLTAMLKLP